MGHSKADRSVWLWLAAVSVAVVIVAGICRSLAHPYGVFWDEAAYINDARIDLLRLQTGRILILGGRILLKSYGKPPAYRVLALPFLALSGFHVTAARLSTLACFALSAWFVYLATGRVASRAAGAFAVLVFALAPEVVGASIFFSTDAPLYLATAAMLYYLFVFWSEKAEHSSTWIGLGLALALGLWSKASFLALALPVLAFALLLAFRKRREGFAPLCKACGLGFILGATWWALNWKDAVAFTREARGFVWGSLGPTALATWARWLESVVVCLLGPAISLLIGMVLVACLRKVVLKKETILTPLQKTAVAACVFAGLPIVLVQLSGTNHMLRHISPAVIPLAIAIGIFADASSWTESRPAIVASGALACIQLGMLVYPVLIPNRSPVDIGFANATLPWRTMARFDQWDWAPLRDISRSCGLDRPEVAFLGGGEQFNPPRIVYPWIAEVADARRTTFAIADVKWLWHYEQGPLDWRTLMDSVAHSDVVITAPAYSGEAGFQADLLDNQYNREFADRLSHDPRFQQPMDLAMGRFAPVEILVFVKSSHLCGLGRVTQGNP